MFSFSDYNNISKFLNRILGMEVALQNAMFKYFSETLTAIILDAKRSGRWDMGILGKSSLFYFSVYKYITLFSQFIDLQLFFLSVFIMIIN